MHHTPLSDYSVRHVWPLGESLPCQQPPHSTRASPPPMFHTASRVLITAVALIWVEGSSAMGKKSCSYVRVFQRETRICITLIRYASYLNKYEQTFYKSCRHIHKLSQYYLSIVVSYFYWIKNTLFVCIIHKKMHISRLIKKIYGKLNV